MATVAHDAAPPAPRLALERVVCGVDGSPRSAGAVREAIALAPAVPQLSFVAVCAAPDGPDAVASLDERRALHALEQAQALAAARGVHATTRCVRADDVAGALLGEAAPGGLLVAGGHGTSRAGGGPPGSVADALLRHATGPLLVARPGPRPRAARPRILVAVDDGPAAADVVRLAGTIAAAVQGYVHLLHVAGREYGGTTRRRLAELSTELIAITGAEPVVDVLHRAQVAASIAQFAHRDRADLVVVGRRSVTGRRALGAVSERVVHTAPCSVLVVPVPRPA